MKLVCAVTDSMHYEDSRGMGRPRIHIGGGEKQGGRNGRPGAGGSARGLFAEGICAALLIWEFSLQYGKRGLL